MVSHEFRTPLAIVDGNAQILERRIGDLPVEDAKKRLKTIRSAVSRTVNMMEAVLSSNLLKTGKMDIHTENFSLRELIEQLCQEQADLARSHVITVDVTGLPETVLLDKKVMTLVLTNLLANAVKYTPCEHPEIHVQSQVDGGEVVILVQDNGVGIPDDEIDKVFDRFFRASTSAGISGSGVGLSLVNDLIKAHKGKINLESQIGVGTRVEIRLPINLPLESISVTH